MERRNSRCPGFGLFIDRANHRVPAERERHLASLAQLIRTRSARTRPTARKNTSVKTVTSIAELCDAGIWQQDVAVCPATPKLSPTHAGADCPATKNLDPSMVW